jgi:hypothetical protein
MRMIDLERKCTMKGLSLFLTVFEAEQLKDELEILLKNPEAKEHFHILSMDNTRELSCSIVTTDKLKDIKDYNKLEQQALTEK